MFADYTDSCAYRSLCNHRYFLCMQASRGIGCEQAKMETMKLTPQKVSPYAIFLIQAILAELLVARIVSVDAWLWSLWKTVNCDAIDQNLSEKYCRWATAGTVWNSLSNQCNPCWYIETPQPSGICDIACWSSSSKWSLRGKMKQLWIWRLHQSAFGVSSLLLRLCT